MKTKLHYIQLLIALHILVVFQLPCLQAQPYISWQVVYGKLQQDDEVNAVAELPDGSYIALGSQSTDLGTAYYYDGLLLRINGLGDTVSQRYGTSAGIDKFENFALLPDGGLIAVGSSNSTATSPVGISHGMTDLWAIRLDDTGQIVWSRLLGGTEQDYGTDVVLLPNNRVALVGYSSSTDGDIANNYGYRDAWAVVLQQDNGETVWQRNYGSESDDAFLAVAYDPNTAQIVAGGYNYAATNDVSQNFGSSDGWIVRINSSNGDIISEASYGGSKSDIIGDLALSNSGEVVFFSESLSSDGQVGYNNGQEDWWIAKINSDGGFIWRQVIGDSSFDNIGGLYLDSEGNLALTGITFDPSIAPPEYLFDMRWVLINNNNGEIIVNQNFGGSLWDFGNTVIRNSTGDWVVGGYSDSVNGDLGGGGRLMHGTDNAWIVAIHFDPVSTNTPTMTPSTHAIPNPTSGVLSLHESTPIRSCTIYSLTGQLLHTFTPNENYYSLSLSSYPAGQYILAWQTDKGYYYQKILKY